LQTKADVAKAEANLAKSYIVDSLVKDGRGAFAREDLEKLDFLELGVLRRTFDSSVSRKYAEVLARRQLQRENDSRPQGTVGSYNQETGEYENAV